MICMMSPCQHPSTCSKACTELFVVLYLSGYRALALDVAVAVEQFSAIRIPHGLRAAFRRDLPLPAWARIGLHVNLIVARFVRAIGQPAPVGGKPWRAFGKRCSEER